RLLEIELAVAAQARATRAARTGADAAVRRATRLALHEAVARIDIGLGCAATGRAHGSRRARLLATRHEPVLEAAAKTARCDEYQHAQPHAIHRPHSTAAQGGPPRP